MERLLKYFAQNLSNGLCRNGERNKLEKDKMQYGIEIMLYNISSVGLILLIALLVGVFKESIIVYLAFGILRLLAGGMHFDTSIECLFTTSFVVIGGAKVSHFYQMEDKLIIAVFIILEIFIWLYAPSGTAEHPIDDEDRNKLKIQSMLVVFIYAVICWFSDTNIKELIIIATCCEVITILPFANRKYLERKRQ